MSLRLKIPWFAILRASFLFFFFFSLRQRPHPGGIRKRSFTSTVSPTVHTNPSQNGAFQTHSSNRRNLKTPVFRFRVDRKQFENGAFRKRWRHDDHVISLTEFSSNANPKWPVIVTLLNSTGRVWTENIWCVFRVKPKFSNFSEAVWTAPTS